MQILIEQEVALHQYETRQNLSEVTRLLHPGFTEIGASGTTYKFEGIRRMMASESQPDYDVHSQDYECICLDPSTCLLLYKAARIHEDGPVTSHSKRSSIWVSTDVGWQMRFHQGTPCSKFELRT